MTLRGEGEPSDRNGLSDFLIRHDLVKLHASHLVPKGRVSLSARSCGRPYTKGE